METTTLVESQSEFSPEQSRVAFVAAFVRRAEEEKRLSIREATTLLRLFESVPTAAGSGLSDAEADRFVSVTAQLIEYCLHEADLYKPGFVNALVQGALDEHFRCNLDTGAWRLEVIDDQGRRARSRRRMFGQVKARPRDPDDPSFFGGSWNVQCGDDERRIVFAIDAHADPEQTSFAPVSVDSPHYDQWRAMVRLRGERPSRLQVDESSPLGEWITALTGAKAVGQHCGVIPLGVLCEAVEREARRQNWTGLLLGPSRRDPPTEPWHAGRFLTPLASPAPLAAGPASSESSDRERWFGWRGLAIDTSSDALITGDIRIRIAARILAETKVG